MTRLLALGPWRLAFILLTAVALTQFARLIEDSGGLLWSRGGAVGIYFLWPFAVCVAYGRRARFLYTVTFCGVVTVHTAVLILMDPPSGAIFVMSWLVAFCGSIFLIWSAAVALVERELGSPRRAHMLGTAFEILFLPFFLVPLQRRILDANALPEVPTGEGVV